MIPRSERHRKQKQRPSERKPIPVKMIAGLTLAAVACLAVGVGAAYITSRTSHEQRLEAASTPVSTAAPRTAADTAASAAPKAQPAQKADAASPSPAASAAPSAAASAKPDDSSAGSGVKLAFVGDVMMAGNVEEILKQNGYNYPYTNVKDYLSKADYTIANLETPVTTRGTAQSKDFVYRSSPDALPALKDSGVDLVNLANNHVMDYGQEGLLDTLDALDQTGLKRVGAGKNAEEAYAPVIVEKQGMKIAFLGFSRVVPEASWKAGPDHAGVAETYSYTLPVEAIQKAKEQADLVVVVAHWGVERADNPDKNQKDLAHRYIDAGADLVVGSHPHVMQGFENYKGKWIAYSLGNFVFTTNDISKTWETAILEASCSKDKQCDVHLVPVLTKGALPTPMNAMDGAKLFERLTQISKTLRTKVDEQGNVIQK